MRCARRGLLSLRPRRRSANAQGGTRLIGVEDDGSITGAQPRHGDVTNPRRLQAMISNKTVPSVVVEVEVVALDDVHVILVEVPKAATVTGTSGGQYTRRGLGGDGRPACFPFLAHEMLASRIERGEVDYAAIEEPGATLDDLDPAEFERLRRLVEQSGAPSALATLSDLDIGRALGVIDGHDDAPLIRRGALLLFGRAERLREFIPTHETAFQVLSGTSVRQNQFGNAPLLSAAEDLYAKLMRYDEEDELDIGLTRISVPRIPAVAARELIANALVHRDWDGLIEMRGNGRGRRYTLSAATYREISAPAGYVRVRAFDDEQQEQMVLSYVRSHGSITRAQAADLCSLNSDAAKNLLRSLKARGVLKMIGERRGARYVLPEATG